MDNRERMKWLVLILVDEYNAKQVDVAKLFTLSSATISLWLKQMRLQYKIIGITREVKELRKIASDYIRSGQIETKRKYDFPPLKT
jgi:predicted transcriptional regulator